MINKDKLYKFNKVLENLRKKDLIITKDKKVMNKYKYLKKQRILGKEKKEIWIN